MSLALHCQQRYWHSTLHLLAFNGMRYPQLEVRAVWTMVAI